MAEDEALIRLDLKEMLEEEGYEVAERQGTGKPPSAWPASTAPTW